MKGEHQAQRRDLADDKPRTRDRQRRTVRDANRAVEVQVVITADILL